MSITVTLPEPTIKVERRGCVAQYLIGHSDVDDYGEPCKVDLYAMLEVSHYGRSEIAGRLEYAYVVTLHAESVEHKDYGSIRHRRIHLGGTQQNMTRLHVEGDQPRFSAKVARRLLDEWTAQLPTLIDSDEVVAAIVSGEAR